MRGSSLNWPAMVNIYLWPSPLLSHKFSTPLEKIISPFLGYSEKLFFTTFKPKNLEKFKKNKKCFEKIDFHWRSLGKGVLDQMGGSKTLQCRFVSTHKTPQFRHRRRRKLKKVFLKKFYLKTIKSSSGGIGLRIFKLFLENFCNEMLLYLSFKGLWDQKSSNLSIWSHFDVITIDFLDFRLFFEILTFSKT